MRIINVITYNIFKILGLLFVYPISLVIHRNRRLWVFGSNFGFADNPKYLFLEVKNKYPDITAVWIYKDPSKHDYYRTKGLDAYYYKSIKGIYYTLFAKVYIYSFRTSDINFYTSGNAVKVNLWHGIALKEIEFRIKKGKMAYRYNGSLLSRYRYMFLYQRPDILLNVGPRYFDILRDSFCVAKERCIVDVYPRCKQFYESRLSQIKRINFEGGDVKDLYKEFGKYTKIYFYMPTFRDSNRNLFDEGGFDFEKLNRALVVSKSLFVIKVHPNTFEYLPSISNYSNIIIIRQQIDVYPLLPFITTLITDYSSIYFDVLLLKKEIMLYPFDINKYRQGDRELVFDYDKDVIGRKIYEFNEMLDVIMNQQDLHLKDEEYNRQINNFWGDEKSRVNLIDFIINKYCIPN